MDESDLVILFAEHLRDKGWHILISRPSQTSIFFRTSAGTKKAPDLVSFKDGLILVFEAKLRCADLFRKGTDGFSDYRSMCFLASSDIAKKELCKRLQSRFKRVSERWRDVVARPKLFAGLLAAGKFSDFHYSLSGLIAVEYDLGHFRVAIENLPEVFRNLSVDIGQ